MEELNKKIAEWVGITDRVPQFTHKIGLCFKYIVPKLRELEFAFNLWDGVGFGNKWLCSALLTHRTWRHYDADAETPALALCLTVEKLINSETNGN